jgi:hypothetical protein
MQVTFSSHFHHQETYPVLNVPAGAEFSEFVCVLFSRLSSLALSRYPPPQPHRRAIDASTADKIQQVIERLRLLAAGSVPFVLTLDDPSGQSLIGKPDFYLLY